jgi:hypothetical protein
MQILPTMRGSWRAREERPSTPLIRDQVLRSIDRGCVVSILHGSPPSSTGFTDVPVPERNSWRGRQLRVRCSTIKNERVLSLGWPGSTTQRRC